MNSKQNASHARRAALSALTTNGERGDDAATRYTRAANRLGVSVPLLKKVIKGQKVGDKTNTTILRSFIEQKPRKERKYKVAELAHFAKNRKSSYATQLNALKKSLESKGVRTKAGKIKFGNNPQDARTKALGEYFRNLKGKGNDKRRRGDNLQLGNILGVADSNESPAQFRKRTRKGFDDVYDEAFSFFDDEDVYGQKWM